MLLGPSRCLRSTQANSSTRPLSAPPPSHSEQFVNSHVQGRYLDEADFWPILEAIEAMDVPLYIHPNTPSKQLIEPFLDRTLEGATRPRPSRRRGRSFHSRDAEPLFCSFPCNRWRRQLALGGLSFGSPLARDFVTRSLPNSTRVGFSWASTGVFFWHHCSSGDVRERPGNG